MVGLGEANDFLWPLHLLLLFGWRSSDIFAELLQRIAQLIHSDM